MVEVSCRTCWHRQAGCEGVETITTDCLDWILNEEYAPSQEEMELAEDDNCPFIDFDDWHRRHDHLKTWKLGG